MRSSKIRILFFLLVVGLIFQGCGKDDEIIENTDEVVDGNRGGNGQGGNGSGNGNNTGNGIDLNGSDSELVYDWTELMLELERYAGGMRPNATARALAYIYLASYETAVPGMREHISNASRLEGLNIDNEQMAQDIHWELALNACFAKTLDHFLLNVPTNLKGKIELLRNDVEEQISPNVPALIISNSEVWGNYVADQVIAYSQTDAAGEAQILTPQPLSYVPPTGDGYWTYSAEQERALFPYWESVRTFVIAPDQTTSVAPITYDETPNSPYHDQMMETYNSNNTAKAEDNDELWIAEFWSDDVEGLAFSPPARQFSISNQLIRQNYVDLEQTLALYVKLGFSLNDAAVATWKYKYEYMVMRPNVFIHEYIDPGYQTNLYRLIPWPNPTFPAYPSGHSCFASAAAGLFIDYFGNEINFTDKSHEGREEFRGAPRTFISFHQMAEENAYSRIPLGVHIRMDCDEGIRLGYEISDAVNDLNLRKNST